MKQLRNPCYEQNCSCSGECIPKIFKLLPVSVCASSGGFGESSRASQGARGMKGAGKKWYVAAESLGGGKHVCGMHATAPPRHRATVPPLSFPAPAEQLRGTGMSPRGWFGVGSDPSPKYFLRLQTRQHGLAVQLRHSTPTSLRRGSAGSVPPGSFTHFRAKNLL